jgi:2-polyprenyl-3-methyl-5-hydroxy-6-metoxy-1,4-benzoquinol methylase
MPRVSSSACPCSEQWPADGIEVVGRCPLCGCRDRTILHRDLWDNVFFAAPGLWNLWRCGACRSGYLDPRPNEATIGLAYSTYYTHETVELPKAETWFQRLRASLGNGYRNWRYGTELAPALPVGAPLAQLLPPLGWHVDLAYRFLPSSYSGQKRVLDIGCGGGEWLRMARGAGWTSCGVEPDPVARERARQDGFDVRATLADWNSESDEFDYVTMSHVIEHVHDPLQSLRDCFALLKQGGGIFIDTPNLDAIGHDLYGRHWRGLEPPRHLVIFNRDSLSRTVTEAGFTRLRYPRRFYPFVELAQRSRRIAAGLDPSRLDEATGMPPPPSRFDRLRSATARRKSEFLTVLAKKP